MRRTSYLDFNPLAPVATSKGRDWHGIIVDLDHLEPVEKDISCYGEHFLGINLGQEVSLLHAMDELTFEGLAPKGSMLLSPAGQSVKWRLDTQADILSMMLLPSFVQQVAVESMGLNPDRVELRARVSFHDPQVEYIGQLFRSELQSDGLGGRLYADSLANVLVVHLVRQCFASTAISPAHERGLPTQRLQRIMEYIEENLHCDLALADLAAVAHMSSYHFARLFRRSMGVAPHQYLIRQRVERAKQLLRDAKFTLAQIAISVGFADQSHLTRHFRRSVGVTPGEFLQRSRR